MLEMKSKTTYYIAGFIGSTIGGYIPTLWGAGFLSITSLLLSTFGGILAIVIVFKYF
jgi:uncharacterized membrane protein YeaQ/YmgE (transglycosylase-associated protein family)